ncbi:MAG: Co2+/Mg2+ efflux protein ApaG [Deltaproteobacteria bacterium]|nr:Co2+/Mg2+ efflux protein ApaG [Deltaproteobacteria bacterium]
MSSATTNGVRVDVKSRWLPERSAPDRHAWLFAYQITITNVGARIVQLVSRHWIIENANGRVEHVRGPGVVGETPILGPGQSFTYTSFCPLDTPVGSMRGTYQMVYPEDRGEPGFDAEIATFTLAVPSALN